MINNHHISVQKNKNKRYWLERKLYVDNSFRKDMSAVCRCPYYMLASSCLGYANSYWLVVWNGNYI